MAKRFVTGLMFLAFACHVCADPDEYILSVISKDFSEVTLRKIGIGNVSTCNGRVVSQEITLKKEIQRLLYREVCSNSGTEYQSKVWYFVEGYSLAYVLQISVRKGDFITKANVSLKMSLDLGSLLYQDYNFEGSRAKKNLHAGHQISAADIIPAGWKLAGESVKVVSNSGSAKISTVGLLAENSYPGSLVRVRIGQKLVVGWIKKDGVVYVD